MSGRVDATRSVSTHRRLLAVLAAGLVPWTVLWAGTAGDLVFPWGLVTTEPFAVLGLPEFLRETTAFEALPARLRAWPVGTVCWLGGLASAGLGVAGREDTRVTAACLALAAGSHLVFTVGFLRYDAYTAVPVGPVVLAGLAAWSWVDAPAPG